MRKCVVRFMVLAATLVVGGSVAVAQDFQKSYSLPPGGSISVGTISGNVTVTGYNGTAVLVTATREGRDAELVSIEDRSTADRVELKVRYPERCNCEASVNFNVMVPALINYEFSGIASVSGDVEISNVTGRVKGSSVSGDVRIKEVAGTVSASAVSGDVEVEISRLEGSGNMKFSSVSGDVRVKLPSYLGAEISLSTLSGKLNSDFPIEVKEKRYGPGRSAAGRVGDGSRTLKMSSVSGNLTLQYN